MIRGSQDYRARRPIIGMPHGVRPSDRIIIAAARVVARGPAAVSFGRSPTPTRPALRSDGQDAGVAGPDDKDERPERPSVPWQLDPAGTPGRRAPLPNEPN